MDSLGDVLGRRNIPKEPDEVRLVKRYVQEQFSATAGVAVSDASIIITVASSSLAAMLRLRTSALRAACNDTSKRLVFRIGPIDTVQKIEEALDL